MSINEKDKINSNNNFTNINKRILRLSTSKKHFEHLSFPKLKNLFLSRAKLKAKEDSLNEYSHSHKKTISSINDIHEKNYFNNTFTTKRKLIEGTESKNKNISSNQLMVKKEQNNLNFYPFNSLENQKSSDNSLNIVSIRFNNRNIKSNKKGMSHKNDDICLNDHLLNNKCKYLFLNFNSNEKLAKKKKYKNKILDTNIFIKAINSLLKPDDKTFDLLEKMINYRIINKESLKIIDDSYFLNSNKNMSQNKIVQIIFKDIINIVIKQMVKRRYNNKSLLISKNEIKCEYYNRINDLKEYINSAKKFHNKNFLKKCQMNSSRNINKSVTVHFKNSKINNNLKEIKEIFTPKILNYNNVNSKENINKSVSNDNLFHYYNFDDVSFEIKKKKLRNGNLDKQINIKFIKQPYFNENFIQKINFQNSLIKNFKENDKNTSNEISQNKSKENDFNKMINISNSSKKNSAMINVINLKSSQILLPEKKQINSYKTKSVKNYSSNNIYSLDNIYILKSKNNLAINSKTKNETNKELNKNLSSINILSRKSEYINNSDYKYKNMNLPKNKLKLKTIKNSFEDKKEEKLKPNRNNNLNNNNNNNNKYSNIFHEKRNKIYNKNDDIINLIKRKNINKFMNEQEEIKKNENNIIKISDNSIENDSTIKENNTNSVNNYKINIKNNNKKDSKINFNKEEYSNENSIYHFDDISTIKINFQNDINNNIESRNKMFKRNNSLNQEQEGKLNKREFVRYNSISYFPKKKVNFLIVKEPKILKDFNGKLNYKDINKEIKSNMAKIMNIIKSNSPMRRHKSIAQNYFELFFKHNFGNDININSNERDFFWKKKKFNKRKKRKERTFKDFLKYSKIEEKEKDNATSSVNILEENEDDKENDWEERFNQFKIYIKKLKNMTNEEFINDTMKFIKK